MFEGIISKIGTALVGKGIGEGLKLAFGTDEDPIQLKQPVGAEFSNATMGMYSPSPSGKAEKIETANYDMTLAMWEKRLYGKDSYTNITIPGMNI